MYTCIAIDINVGENVKTGHFGRCLHVYVGDVLNKKYKALEHVCVCMYTCIYV